MKKSEEEIPDNPETFICHKCGKEQASSKVGSFTFNSKHPEKAKVYCEACTRRREGQYEETE